MERIARLLRSHPTRVRGLKRFRRAKAAFSPLSHPTRVRGLKPRRTAKAASVSLSHPTRVRGLKPVHELRERGLRGVAPHAGAWIETETVGQGVLPCLLSHPTRVRGLKPL